jgi:type IV pilus assembly protein PilC
MDSEAGSAVAFPGRRQPASLAGGVFMAQAKRIRLDSGELAWLCEQVALIQKSGIPLPEGIEMLAQSADVPRQQAVLRGLSAKMQKMVPLSEAMEAMDTFPDYLVRMAKVGEVSGNLDSVMASLADFYARDDELRKKIRSALVYPLILLVMMLGIIVLLVARVLPVFSQILSSFGGSMPSFSQGLLSFGLFIARQSYWLLPLIIVLIIGIVLWLRRTTAGRRLADRAKLGLPLVGSLYSRIYTSRFAVSLAYMLRSGIDMDSALGMAESVMGNALVAERIADCRDKIRKGADTFAALQETRLFPRLFIKMLSLGNQTGDLDAVMTKIARAYESEVDNRLTRLTGVIEPLLVVILSLIVGAILLTVMLPLVEIMASIG